MTTQNPAATTDELTLTVRRTIHIAASRESVWAAVTEPAHISRWFAPTVLDGSGPGATGTIAFAGYGIVPLQVVSVEPLRSVSYRWNNDDSLGVAPDEFDEDHATTFTFTLEDAPGGTELTVVESGFEVTSNPQANMSEHRKGWTSELDKLVTLLEDDVQAVA